MSSISHITIPPARHTLALGLIMVTMTMMLTVTTTTSIFLVPPLVQSALADHGQEVVLSEKDSSFAPVSSDEGGNQVKVVVNYDVRDPMTLNDLAKAVMKVYSPDGTLVKTSSSPTPFRITDDQGTTTLATTLTDTTIEGVTAKIVFTNPIKTETISNELTVSVGNLKGATLSKEPQEEIIPQNLSQPQLESSQDVPIKPLSDALGKEPIFQQNQKITSEESTPQTTTTTDNPFMLETETETTTAHAPQELPMTQQNQKITSEESTPQTTTTTDNPFMSETETETTTAHAPDPDITAQHQLRLQQEQNLGQTPEICEDSLDNDLDGKIDGRDEQCIGFTTSSSSPSIETQSSQAQPPAEKEIGGEDTDKAKEQQSAEDISENPSEKEDSDDAEDEDSDEQPDEEGSDDDDDDDDE
jgi:hypothetical protein